MRAARDREGLQGRIVSISGARLLNFASNDYLGLSAHPDVTGAAQKAVLEYGAGSGAARLLAGGTLLHQRLEEETAKFLGRESAIIFNSGYHANLGAIPALSGPEAEIFSDELNHASIIDGCRLSRAKVHIYKHKDNGHLEDLLKASGARKKLIATESVFSMDGDTAPLEEIFHLSEKYNALLYVDEAHAIGVFGGGRGLVSQLDLPPIPRLVQMGTFGKALGSYGAFIAADKDIIAWLQNTARTFLFSTALPSSIIGASLAALEIVSTGKAPIKTLWANRDFLLNGLKNSGLVLCPTESPIIPILFDSVEEVNELSKKLFDSGIYAPAIRPPTVKRPRLRITVSASHEEGDIGKLVATLKLLLR